MRIEKQAILIILNVVLVAVFGTMVTAQTNSKPTRTSIKALKAMTNKASGTFEVKVTPVKDDEASAVEGIGRLSLNKTWAGDLVGTAKGQMLGSSNADQTSGGYVAMEVFTGTLNGKKGSFALQHNGTMGGGKFDINVEVIPGSGTDELKGISGKLKIIIAGGKHSYEFEYSLPNSK